MRILLTGSTGFLGKHVVKELERNGIQYCEFIHSVNGDLCDSTKLSYFIENDISSGNKFDAIIHMAARVGGIGFNIRNPYNMIMDNLKMGLNLVESCIHYKIPKVINVGTICSYPSVPRTIPFIESEINDGYPHSSNAGYGWAKKTISEVLLMASLENRLKSVTLNLANLYGPGDSEDVEQNHVIPALISKLKTAKLTGIPAVLWGNGQASRDFLHVKCASRAIVKSLTLDSGPVNGMNCGTGIETKIVDLVKYISKLINLSDDMILWDSSRSNGQERRVLDCSKIREILGWTSEIDLQDGILELVGEI